MHIIADVNKISKTVQGSLTFILNVLSESSIHFYVAFNNSCQKECWYFHIKWFFYRKWGCLTVRNYAGRCKGILQLQSRVQLFDIAFAIKKFSFCGALFRRILAWKRDISKRYFLVWNCSFLCSLSLAI